MDFKKWFTYACTNTLPPWAKLINVFILGKKLLILLCFVRRIRPYLELQTLYRQTERNAMKEVSGVLRWKNVVLFSSSQLGLFIYYLRLEPKYIRISCVLGWNRLPAQVGCMRQALAPGALGGPGGRRWGGRWEGGSGWGRHVNPRPFHFNVWQNSLQIKKKKRISCVLKQQC